MKRKVLVNLPREWEGADVEIVFAANGDGEITSKALTDKLPEVFTISGNETNSGDFYRDDIVSILALAYKSDNKHLRLIARDILWLSSSCTTMDECDEILESA